MPESELPENQVNPDPQLEKKTRRQFSTEYKLRILAEADQCAHGELGKLPRRDHASIADLCFRTGLSVVAPDFRLAPENPFPEPLYGRIWYGAGFFNAVSGYVVYG